MRRPRLIVGIECSTEDLNVPGCGRFRNLGWRSTWRFPAGERFLARFTVNSALTPDLGVLFPVVLSVAGFSAGLNRGNGRWAASSAYLGGVATYQAHELVDFQRAFMDDFATHLSLLRLGCSPPGSSRRLPTNDSAREQVVFGHAGRIPVSRYR